MRPQTSINWTRCVVCLACIYFIAAWLFSVALGRQNLFHPGMYLRGYLYTYLVVILPYLMAGAWRSFRLPSLFSLIRWPQHDLTESCRRVLGALPLLIVMPFFMAAFTTMKNLISLAIPFTWDPALTAMDAAIHFGRQPWQWIGIGNWALTLFIDLLYIAWVSLLTLVQVFMALRAPQDPVRNTFFLLYVISFILLGNVAAAVFMSAGPFFPGPNGHPDPAFEPLMSYLWHGSETALLKATFYQQYLLAAYRSGLAEFGSGISAFPSMHVAITMLYVLAAWRHPIWRGLAVCLLVAMTIGSVHLGWHYAVDGYASIIAMIALWRLAYPLVCRYTSNGVSAA